MGIACGLLSLAGLILFGLREPRSLSRSWGLAPAIAGVLLLIGFSSKYAVSDSGVSEELGAAADGRRSISYFTRSLVSSGLRGFSGALEYAAFGEEYPQILMKSDPCSGAISRSPHIILILDESAMNFAKVPKIITPDWLVPHFRSFDGTFRDFGVEAFGAPTIYSELSAITGVPSRSFGDLRVLMPRFVISSFKYSLFRALGRCGYVSSTVYPVEGRFQHAREAQMTLGVNQFVDQADMKANARMRDGFYFDNALKLLAARDLKKHLTFTYILTMSNHFTWDFEFEPQEKIDGLDPRNPKDVNEYFRRQTLSQRDFVTFKAHLAETFPEEQFLIVRFGDHQPFLARPYLEHEVSDAKRATSIAEFSLLYFTTYFAVDTVNFTPTAALPDVERLDAPYLGAEIAHLAGLPLDGVQRFQLDAIERCRGAFYNCDGGRLAKHFTNEMIRNGLLQKF